MVEISPFTLLLVLCLLICAYLISLQKRLQRQEPAHQKLKRFTKNSSEKSITTLPKISSSTYKTKKVVRICITGGPGSGKTNSLARLAFRLPEMGYRVITVPEAAALLKEGGVNISMSSLDLTQQILIELKIIRLQMALEDIYTEIAERTPGKVVVLCNSGVVDSSAYVSQEVWQAILDELGVTQVHLRDFRYDAVIHLVTSAQGAEKAYIGQRKKYSIEEARNIDKSLLDAYTGHPKFSIVGNENPHSPDDKMQKVIDIVFNTLNIKTANQFSHKVLVRVECGKDDIPVIPDYIKSQKIYVEETFLESIPGEVSRVQKRGHSDSYNYLHTVDKTRSDGTSETESQIISPRDYMKYLEKRDKTRYTVKRLLQCFIKDGDYIIIDAFLNVRFKGCLLRVETNKRLEEMTFPEFITFVRDVKNDKGYSTHKLAKINWYDSPDYRRSESLDLAE